MDGKRGDGATPLIVHTELEVAKVLIELNANVDLQDEVRRHVCEYIQGSVLVKHRESKAKTQTRE